MSTVVLEVEYYNELLKAEAKLSALESGGVDNWEGYEIAMEGYEEPKLIEDNDKKQGE